jgi:hypothetical protein
VSALVRSVAVAAATLSLGLTAIVTGAFDMFSVHHHAQIVHALLERGRFRDPIREPTPRFSI